MCGSAHSQDKGDDKSRERGPDSLARLVAADAALLLTHADPVVRGEAALVVAPSLPAQHQGTLLAMARDPAPAARHRALIALGLAGTPAAMQLLDDVLQDTGTRGEDDGVAAAFAVGLLPAERATTITARVLTAMARGSWKRQRPALLALLSSMSSQPERGEGMALRLLLDDESNRDPDVRALLLGLLLPIDRTLDGKPIRRVLERGSDAERCAVLAWLATEPVPPDAELLAMVERLATHGDPAAVRARALAVLTRASHLPALDIAARALRSAQPVECGQGVRSMLAIGGARLLRALAQRVTEEKDPSCKAAMIAGFDAPLTPELADHCAALAADPTAPWPLRSVAAITLARSLPERAAPLLRDVFRVTTETAALPALARALQRCAAEPVALPRLLEEATELLQQRDRWCALLVAEHPEAQRQVLLHLRERLATASSLAITLSAWRRATVLDAPAAGDTVLPDVLVSLLRGR